MKRLTLTLVALFFQMSLATTALATDVYIVDDGVSVHVGRMIVVTNDTPMPAEACGLDLVEYLAVIVSGGPATHTTIKVNSAINVRAGDRFTIVSQDICDAHIMLIIEPL